MTGSLSTGGISEAFIQVMEDDAQCELIIGIPAGGTFECL